MPCCACAGAGGGSGRRFESRRRRPASPTGSRSPAMDAAPEEGPAGTEAEPDGLPCPEPPASRLSAAELDRELDSRSELVRRHFRAVVPCPPLPSAPPPVGWVEVGKRSLRPSCRQRQRSYCEPASGGAGIGRHWAAGPALPCLTPGTAGRARRECPGRNVPSSHLAPIFPLCLKLFPVSCRCQAESDACVRGGCKQSVPGCSSRS